MYDVQDEDLRLSHKYVEAQNIINTISKERIEKYKDVNSDTVEATLLFEANKKHFNSIVGSYPAIKHELILQCLEKTFPELDRQVVSKRLIKSGILPYKWLLRILFFFLLILGLIAVVFLPKVIFIYPMLILLGGIIFLLIDTYVLNSQ